MKKTSTDVNLKTPLLLCLILASVSPAWAYSPLNTDDAGTTARGTNQIEQYFFVINQYDPAQAADRADSSGEDYQGVGTARAFPFVYMRGLTDNLEASFSPTYYASPNGSFSSFTNYTAALKWRFHGDGEHGWNFALKPQIILPATADQQLYGIGNAMLNYGVTAIASRYWEQAELHFNAAYIRAPYNSNYMIGFSPDPNRTNLYFLSMAPVWVATPKIKIALDVGFNTNPSEPEQSLTTYAMIAMIFAATKDIDIGISYQRNAPNYGAIFAANEPYTSRFQIGVNWRFE